MLLRNFPEPNAGGGYGICAGQVCQVCGEPTAFSGWAALFVVFKDRTCVGGWTAGRHRRHAHAPEEIDAMLAGPTRYCEVCRMPVASGAATRTVSWWYCNRCGQLMRDLAPDRTADQTVRALVYWRWRSLKDR